MKSYVLISSINRNKTVDMPEKDWENNKVRPVI